MTTAMALEYDKGEFVLALGLGIVLLAISLAVNVLLGYAQGRTQR
jgi:tungstate transport system permease protein